VHHDPLLSMPSQFHATAIRTFEPWGVVWVRFARLACSVQPPDPVVTSGMLESQTSQPSYVANVCERSCCSRALVPSSKRASQHTRTRSRQGRIAPLAVWTEESTSKMTESGPSLPNLPGYSVRVPVRLLVHCRAAADRRRASAQL
jgi:hypothetical protein